MLQLYHCIESKYDPSQKHVNQNKNNGPLHTLVQLTYTLGIQSRTVLSRDAEATRWPDGENRTHMTAS